MLYQTIWLSLEVKPENWLIIIGPSENHVERVQLNYEETIISRNCQTTTESFGFKLNATIKGNIWLGAWKGVARRAWKYISCHREAILVFVWSIVWIFLSVHLCEVIVPKMFQGTCVPVYLCTCVVLVFIPKERLTRLQLDCTSVYNVVVHLLFKNRWTREKM